MDAPRRDTNQMPALLDSLEIFVCEILARDGREILEDEDTELGRNRERPIDAEPRCWRQKKKTSRTLKSGQWMREQTNRLSILLSPISRLIRYSSWPLVLVERVLPAYYASMLRDKNLQQPASSKAQWEATFRRRRKLKISSEAVKPSTSIRLRARLQVGADVLYEVLHI
jgi:hypothetical protein